MSFFDYFLTVYIESRACKYFGSEVSISVSKATRCT